MRPPVHSVAGPTYARSIIQAAGEAAPSGETYAQNKPRMSPEDHGSPWPPGYIYARSDHSAAGEPATVETEIYAVTPPECPLKTTGSPPAQIHTRTVWSQEPLASRPRRGFSYARNTTRMSLRTEDTLPTAGPIFARSIIQAAGEPTTVGTEIYAINGPECP